MIKHIILWQLREELPPEERAAIKANAKHNLEALQGQIDGLYEIRVITEALDASNADMMLDSTFLTEEALHNYSRDPRHTAVADTYVRPYVQHRSCINYKV